MGKDESGLKSALMREIKLSMPGAVALRHEDVRTAGIPDLSLTWRGKTSWWECKHATPDFAGTGIQKLTMLRLAGAGYARYIVWHEHKDETCKQTMIVCPRNIGTLTTEFACVGYNHRFIVECMRKAHGA